MYECHGLIHIVKEGDTMYKIAKMHHVSLWELMYENPYVNVYRLQPGDEDLSQIPFSEIAGRNLAVEEKCDGANSAVSFSADGELLLQSRGHYLTGGYRERH